MQVDLKSDTKSCWSSPSSGASSSKSDDLRQFSSGGIRGNREGVSVEGQVGGSNNLDVVRPERDGCTQSGLVDGMLPCSMEEAVAYETLQRAFELRCSAMFPFDGQSSFEDPACSYYPRGRKSPEQHISQGMGPQIFGC